MTGLTPGATYYFAATAYDASGQESDYSNEVAVTIPVAPYLKIAMGSQHEALLTGTGLVGASYDVLASQDMQKWTSIGTVTTAVDGTFSFTDWDAALYPARFYRLRQS